jgi:hypothetical protein
VTCSVGCARTALQDWARTSGHATAANNAPPAAAAYAAFAQPALCMRGLATRRVGLKEGAPGYMAPDRFGGAERYAQVTRRQ